MTPQDFLLEFPEGNDYIASSMDQHTQISQAAETIKNQIKGSIPQKAIILGSGLSAWADQLDEKHIFEAGDIPHWPRPTVTGHPGKVVVGKSDGIPVIGVQGRLHLYEGFSVQEVVFPVRVLGAIGISQLIVTHAAGGLNTSFSPGDLMLITDHINLMGANPLVGLHDSHWGERFPDMSQPYDLTGRTIALDAAEEMNIQLHQGILAAVLGPSYETAAEVNMLQVLGADAVCMSTVPEVITAVQMGIRVLGISAITNLATGLTIESLSHNKIENISYKNIQTLTPLLQRVLSRWDTTREK